MSPNRLVVVGGGIIGTMHAYHGVRRGYEVVQIERDSWPRGASVRNFGLVWVSGRSGGAELDLALRARDLWEEIAAIASVPFRPAGSLTVANNEQELAVIIEAAELDDAKERGFELLTPQQAREKNSALTGAFLGALFCERDAIVEPRLTLAALREYLGQSGQYTFLPGRQAMSVDAHVVVDHTGKRHEGDLVACCTGARPGGFLEEALSGEPLRRVRLQMLETKPFAKDVGTSLADGDSLRYYPAYENPANANLLPQDELATQWRAQLLLVKRLSGHLTIGDTHAYDEPFPFDVDDAPYDHLLAVASKLLGEIPPVERRWAGVYSQVIDDNLLYLRKDIAPGVVVVTGPGGRGMTMAPAIAEETFL